MGKTLDARYGRPHSSVFFDVSSNQADNQLSRPCNQTQQSRGSLVRSSLPRQLNRFLLSFPETLWAQESMVVRSIELGSLDLRIPASRLSLTISSSFLLEAPTSLGEKTAAELSQKSREGSIWISKSGSCRVDFSLCLPADVHNLPEELRHSMVGLMANCPVSLSIGIRRWPSF